MLDPNASDPAILEHPGRHRRNDEIEVLRAAGVLFTMLEHLNSLLFWRTSDLGAFFGGVDLFFCISGFVITSAFGEEIASATRSSRLYWRTVAAFWMRRAYRIIPLAWTVLLVWMVLLIAVAPSNWPVVLLASGGDFIALVFDVANFHFAWCAEKVTATCGINGIYWSISLEEQFYLVFPFLFLLPRRLMVVGLVGVVLTFMWIPRSPVVWMVRLDAIALGVLLGLIRSGEAYRAFEPRFLAAPMFRWMVFLLLLIGLVIMPAEGGLVPFYPTMVSIIALLLVFVASYDRDYLMAPGRLRSLLVWIGQRSFALYLIHNAVFWLVAGTYRRLFSYIPPGRILAVVFVLAAAVLLCLLSDASFRFLETPLRQRGKRVAAEFLREGEPSSAGAVSPAEPGLRSRVET